MIKVKDTAENTSITVYNIHTLFFTIAVILIYVLILSPASFSTIFKSIPVYMLLTFLFIFLFYLGFKQSLIINKQNNTFKLIGYQSPWQVIQEYNLNDINEVFLVKSQNVIGNRAHNYHIIYAMGKNNLNVPLFRYRTSALSSYFTSNELEELLVTTSNVLKVPMRVQHISDLMS